MCRCEGCEGCGGVGWGGSRPAHIVGYLGLWAVRRRVNLSFMRMNCLLWRLRCLKIRQTRRPQTLDSPPRPSDFQALQSLRWTFLRPSDPHRLILQHRFLINYKISVSFPLFSAPPLGAPSSRACLQRILSGIVADLLNSRLVDNMPALTAAAVPVHIAVKAGEVDTPALIALDKATRVSAVEAIISRLQNDGPTVFKSISLAQGLLAAISDKKSPLIREAAVSAIHLLASKGAVKHLEPYVLGDATTGLFPALLEAFADKTPAVRALAVDAVLELVRGASPWATAQIIPPVLTQIKSAGKWQVKTGCLLVLNELVKSAPAQTAALTPDIIPVLSEAIWDTKADVKKAARDTLQKTTALVSNKSVANSSPLSLVSHSLSGISSTLFQP